jgi:hypothetical protein
MALRDQKSSIQDEVKEKDDPKIYTSEEEKENNSILPETTQYDEKTDKVRVRRLMKKF